MKKQLFSLVLVFSVLLSSFISISAANNLRITSDGQILESTDDIYSAINAITYARNFTEESVDSSTKTYNKYYPNAASGGNDCANFVSQCLLYGGLKQSDAWWVKSETYHKNNRGKAWCSDAWYNVDYLFYFLTGNYLPNSKSFNPFNHHNFPYRFLLTSSKADKKEAFNAIEIGDIIYTNGSSAAYGHVMIVSKIDRAHSKIYACGHTNNRLDTELSVNNVQAVVYIRYKSLVFDLNCGEGALPNRIIKEGDAKDIIMGNIGNEIPTRDDYTFIGWSSTPNNSDYSECISSVNVNNPEFVWTDSSWTFEDYCKYTGSNSNKNSLVLYAQWEAKSYVIKFNANGGTGSVPRTMLATGTNIIGKINYATPTRAGYTFLGWSATPNASYDKIIGNINGCCTYDEYCESTGGDSSKSTLILYAQWRENVSKTYTSKNKYSAK